MIDGHHELELREVFGGLIHVAHALIEPVALAEQRAHREIPLRDLDHRHRRRPRPGRQRLVARHPRQAETRTVTLHPDPAARLTDVTGKYRHGCGGAHQQLAMAVTIDAVAEADHCRLAARIGMSEIENIGRFQPGVLRHPLRRVRGDVRRQEIEHGGRRYTVDLTAPVERGGRGLVRRTRPAALAVPDPEHRGFLARTASGGPHPSLRFGARVRRRCGAIAGASRLADIAGRIARAQQPAVVEPHQERCRRMCDGERRIDEIFRDEDAQQSERERQVGADARRQPPGRVHGRGRVARIDHHQFAARIARIEQELHRGECGFSRIVAPYQNELRAHPIRPFVGVLAIHALVAEGAVEAHVHGQIHTAVKIHAAAAAEQRSETRITAEGRGARGAGEGDALRTVLRDERGEARRDFIQCRIPGNRLELSRAARACAPHRLRDAFLAVDPLREGQAAHAGTGVGWIGHIGSRDPHQLAIAHRAGEPCPAAAVMRAHRVDDLVAGHSEGLLWSFGSSNARSHYAPERALRCGVFRHWCSRRPLQHP